MRRILHYTAAAVPGGLLLGHLMPLALGTANKHYASEVWLRPDAALDDDAATLERGGVTIQRLTIEGKTDLGGMLAFSRAYRRARPDILHIHLASPVESLPVILIAARLSSAPILTTEHLPTYHPAERAWSRSLKAAVPVGRIITVSPADAEYLVTHFGLPREKMRYVPNGVAIKKDIPSRTEARERLRLPASAIVAAYVGEITERKGLVELVEAWSAVDAKAIILLAGAGPLAEELANRARAAGLTERFRLLGSLRPPDLLYAACDLFVLPSHHEAMPLALLEAMAALRPVVATHVGGIPEVVREGVEGYLVAPRDPKALAAALGRMIGDEKARERMGSAARRRVEESFSVEKMIAGTCAVYDELLAEKRR